jgi:hypothetical protein
MADCVLAVDSIACKPRKRLFPAGAGSSGPDPLAGKSFCHDLMDLASKD